MIKKHFTCIKLSGNNCRATAIYECIGIWRFYSVMIYEPELSI